MSKTIIIIGAGLAGLSAALQAAENGCNVKLVSSLPSGRHSLLWRRAVSTQL